MILFPLFMIGAAMCACCCNRRSRLRLPEEGKKEKKEQPKRRAPTTTAGATDPTTIRRAHLKLCASCSNLGCAVGVYEGGEGKADEAGCRGETVRARGGAAWWRVTVTGACIAACCCEHGV